MPSGIASPRSSRGSGPKLAFVPGSQLAHVSDAELSPIVWWAPFALAHHNAVAIVTKERTFANLLKYNICCQCDTVVDLLLGKFRSSHQQLLELRLRLAELQPAAHDPKNILWWLDRDTNPCLNFQRIGESKQRPIELCSWTDLEALPPIGKEYHQRYKLVNDRLPKARQRLHRAAEYRRGIDGRARNNA
ncbi:hypothetical protein QJQ45_009181 [Haematococcus lacustris]|nr:hypothetical protein QJQ45_009181 [Haematococcus lacustris]